MYIKKLVVLLIISTLPYILVSQTISGKIVNEEGLPVEFATVVLQELDSTFVETTISDSLGIFMLNKQPESYRLILQHIQYNSVVLESTEQELGDIAMTSKADVTISDFVVTKKRPLVKVNEGILTYNLQQITHNKVVSNAYEALLELPGVSERNDILNLAGAADVTIIINGSPTTMSASQVIELLKQMPASYVETADVMYSAPPQYHVRGAAINLTINKMSDDEESTRFQGEFRGSYDQKHYANYTAGTSLLYSTDKIATDFMYTVSDIKTRTGLDLLSLHNLNDVAHRVEQSNKGWTEKLLHSARIGLDFKPKENNLLSLAYTTSISTDGKSVENSLGTHSNSHNTKKFKDQFHNIALDYTSGFGFKAGVNYTFFKTPASQHFTDTNNTGTETEFISDSQQKINSFLIYADQSHKLKRGWGLNYGAKFSYAKDHDYQLYNIVEGESSLYNTDKTIKEYLYNFYVGTNKSFSEQLTMNLSFAGEYYKLSEDSDWSILPQAQLTYMHSSDNIFQFSFSSNKNYPSYWEKQDYKGYLNSYSVIYGNPSLKAFNSYSTQLAYIKNQRYVFALYYVYQPKYSVQLGYQSSQKLELIYQVQNWDYNQFWGVNVEVPFTVGKWLDSRLSLNGFHQQAKHNHFFDIKFNNKKFVGYARIDNTFNVSTKPNIKLNLSAHYMTKPIQGIMDLSKIWGVDASAKWTFAKNNAELNFKAIDIFNSSMPNVFIRSQGQHLDMHNLANARSFIFSLVYKFGGYKSKARKDIDKSRYGH